MKLPPESSDVGAARKFALLAHRDQMYGSRPYIYHLDQVAALLSGHGLTAQVIGYLHDVLEDTAVSREQLAARFGEFVAECVEVLSDPPGETRRVRKAAAYAHMAGVRGAHELALVVKLADRLANVAASVADELHDKLATYREEHPAFRAAAFRPGACDAMWARLDALLAT